MMASHSSSTSLNFFLPWPPSENHYRRAVRTTKGACNVKTKRAKTYPQMSKHALEMQHVLPAKTLKCNVQVIINATPPDNKRRDLDNLLKASLDAMTHCGIYEDDSQIQELTIRWRMVVSLEQIQPWARNYIATQRGFLQVFVTGIN